jgi:DUF1009 family protein
MRADGPVVLIAGAGRLPRLVAASLGRRGHPHRILALRGFADRDTRRAASASVGLLEVERILDILDRWAPRSVALIGAVQRPPLSAVLAALSALRGGGELARLFARGDDNLLGGVVRLIEGRGHRVSGLQELAPELLAPAGLRGAHAPTDRLSGSIALGLNLLSRLSPFDIGQAAVVGGERVLAIEGPEGTDRMLARVRPRLIERLLLRHEPQASVLVKAAKQGQDLRVDLPAIGPRTLARAARAGLGGVAYGAGSVLIIDDATTIATADRLGLFLVGVDPKATP